MDDTTDRPQPDEPAAATDQSLGGLTRRQILVATAALGMLRHFSAQPTAMAVARGGAASSCNPVASAE